MTTDPDRREDWVTTAEAARMLRRTPSTVLAWSRRGLLPSAGRLPDGGYLFERAAVVALVRGVRPVRHAAVDPASVRAFVDAAHRRAVGRGSG